MKFQVRKIIHFTVLGMLTLGISGSLMNKASAKHNHYQVRHHRSARFHKQIRRFRKRHLIKKKRHVKKYRYRPKRSKRKKKFSIRKVSRRRVKKIRRTVKPDPEVNQNQDLNTMNDVKQLEYQTIKLINIDRAAHNLKPLRATLRLRRLARKRADQLAKLDYLTHHDANGKIVYEKDAKQMKIQLGSYSGENIASTGLGPILMDSNPNVYSNNNGKDMANMAEDEMINHDQDSNWGHRYNTLNPHYKSMGIGAEQKAGTNNYYLAENFSSQR